MPRSSAKIHVSDDGNWNTRAFRAHAWTSGENRAKKWTYWWLSIEPKGLTKADYKKNLDVVLRAKGLTKAEFEVFRDGAIVVERQELLPADRLFAITGFVDEEPEEADGPIGGAAKLDVGAYAVDFYLTIGGTTHVLRGVRFEVAGRRAKRGGWQITTPLKGKTKG